VPDFSVDLDALTRAANGIHDVLEELGAHKVADIDCNQAAFGHDRLAGTVRDFCHRWQNGVMNLTHDGAQIADRLAQSALTYHEAEATAVDALEAAWSGANPADGAVTHGLEAV